MDNKPRKQATPASIKTAERARELQLLSAKKKRDKRSFRSELEKALARKETNPRTGETLTRLEIMAERLALMAARGDLNAIKYVAELIGEAPSKRSEVTVGADDKTLKILEHAIRFANQDCIPDQPTEEAAKEEGANMASLLWASSSNG